MKKIILIRNGAIALTVLLITASCIAWQPKRVQQSETLAVGDTSKPNSKTTTKSSRIKDLDKAISDIEKSMQNLSIEIDGNLSKTIEESIQKALLSINFDQIATHVDAAMKEVHHHLNNNDVTIKQDKEAFKKEMEKVKLEMEKHKVKLKEEMKKVKIDVTKEMEAAKQEMENAKTELKEMKNFMLALEADGLINDTDENLTIEWQGDDLWINGKQQTKAVSSKYLKYKKEGKMHFNGKKHSEKF